MYHFFAESAQLFDDGKRISITGDTYNHMVNVLRMKVGEEFSVNLKDELSPADMAGESFPKEKRIGELSNGKSRGLSLKKHDDESFGDYRGGQCTNENTKESNLMNEMRGQSQSKDEKETTSEDVENNSSLVINTSSFTPTNIESDDFTNDLFFTKEYRFGIESISDTELIGELRFIKESGTELPSKIYLFQGLPKADKMELIIQKAVELGAYQIIPVKMKRSVVKLDDKKAAAKVKRWCAISEAAAKQSKRAIIPEVTMPMTYKEAVKYAENLDIKLLPYELAEGMDYTREIISNIKPGQSIGIFVGPEGGFADEEVDFAKDNGFKPITMGKRILRTETAGFTMLSWLMYNLEV